MSILIVPSNGTQYSVKWRTFQTHFKPFFCLSCCSKLKQIFSFSILFSIGMIQSNKHKVSMLYWLDVFKSFLFPKSFDADKIRRMFFSSMTRYGTKGIIFISPLISNATESDVWSFFHEIIPWIKINSFDYGWILISNTITKLTCWDFVTNV